jgi:hypothetical protein
MDNCEYTSQKLKKKSKEKILMLNYITLILKHIKF